MRSCLMRELSSSYSDFPLSQVNILNLNFLCDGYRYCGTGTSQSFKNVIKNNDPTTFNNKLDYVEQKSKKMFDRRYNSYKDVDAYLFNANYTDGSNIKIYVNSEDFIQTKASEYASQYAKVIGQLPKALRKQVNSVWIHGGKNPFGGDKNPYGDDNYLLIHVEQGDEYIKQEILEEVLIHEACHASLDILYANNSKWKNDWKKAQEKDNAYISKYAKDFPEREDIAESFLAYFAYKYRKDRISDYDYEYIEKTIQNRIKFFDSLKLDMSI